MGIIISSLFIITMENSYGATDDVLKKNKVVNTNLIKVSKVQEYKIVVTDRNGKKHDYKIKGVCYSRGDHGQEYYKYFKKDLIKLKALNATTVRTYRPLAAYYKNGNIDYKKTKIILDTFAKNGINVVVGFDSLRDIVGGNVNGKQIKGGVYKTYIKKFSNHPAILMWAFGNEYNYHYAEWFNGKRNWINILSKAASAAKKLSPNRIVATVHGEIPTSSEIKEYNRIKGLDLIMINVWRGSSFGNLFNDWKEKTNSLKKPIVISEFGRSSKNGKGKDTSKQQANIVKKLWEEIASNKKIAGGGFVFELNDEKWKGQRELSSMIGSEAHLGLFTDKYNNFKKDAKLVARTLSKLWKRSL